VAMKLDADPVATGDILTAVGIWRPATAGQRRIGRSWCGASARRVRRCGGGQHDAREDHSR
jgi:hypothetical protein